MFSLCFLCMFILYIGRNLPTDNSICRGRQFTLSCGITRFVANTTRLLGQCVPLSTVHFIGIIIAALDIPISFYPSERLIDDTARPEWEKPYKSVRRVVRPIAPIMKIHVVCLVAMYPISDVAKEYCVIKTYLRRNVRIENHIHLPHSFKWYIRHNFLSISTDSMWYFAANAS